MRIFNCQKRAYKATSLQWTGDNTAEVLAAFPDAQLFGARHIMIRHAEGISTLGLGTYIVTGENGEVKSYDEVTYHIKYEDRPCINRR